MLKIPLIQTQSQDFYQQKLVLMVHGPRGVLNAVALETTEIIDFGTKTKLNEKLAFAPVKKDSEEYKALEEKFKNENAVDVFQESSGAMGKDICKDVFLQLENLGLPYTDLLGDGDSKDFNKVKGIYGVCKDCEAYDKMTANEKEVFDKSAKGIKFLQKHRKKKVDCRRVNMIECINHVDKKGGTALRDLRDCLKGKK